MIISELEIRSYKSFGNNPQTIKLNTDSGELVLLVGMNGSGKSLVPETEIDIELEINNLSEFERKIFYRIMDQ
jgi:ABC-type Mn2+/Zn2+ transport system ATPase subunit